MQNKFYTTLKGRKVCPAPVVSERLFTAGFLSYPDSAIQRRSESIGVTVRPEVPGASS